MDRQTERETDRAGKRKIEIEEEREKGRQRHTEERGGATVRGRERRGGG